MPEYSIGDLAARHVELREDMNRRFTDTNNHMERRFTELSNQMREMTFVPRNVFTLELQARDIVIANLRSDLNDFLERETWRNRALVTAFIFPVLLLIVAAFLITGPK